MPATDKCKWHTAVHAVSSHLIWDPDSGTWAVSMTIEFCFQLTNLQLDIVQGTASFCLPILIKGWRCDVSKWQVDLPRFKVHHKCRSTVMSPCHSTEPERHCPLSPLHCDFIFKWLLLKIWLKPHCCNSNEMSQCHSVPVAQTANQLPVKWSLFQSFCHEHQDCNRWN